MSFAAEIVAVPVDDIEILAALRGAPGVRTAVVLERVAADGTTSIVGYVVGPDPAHGAARVRQHLAGNLAEYMIPDRVVVLTELPLTPAGEFDLAAIPAPDPVSDASVPPRTPVEHALADVFRDLLGADDVGVHDSFFALGGSSILATRVAARIRETFGVDVSLVDVLAAPTIDELAILIGSSAAL